MTKAFCWSRTNETFPRGHVMKFQLILILVLCAALAASESNGRKRTSHRRRPPAEVPENLDEELEPELQSEPDELPIEAPAKNEKVESKPAETTQQPADDKEKRNGSSPLSQLFAPRGTRRPRPAPRDSKRPRPTLPSFIKNPNRVARPTAAVAAASSRITQKKATTASSTARTSKATVNGGGGGNSSRRRTTPVPVAADSAEAGKRFGRNGRQKGTRSSSLSS